jgi:D-alanyl-D-alanine carboxypeptidase
LGIALSGVVKPAPLCDFDDRATRNDGPLPVPPRLICRYIRIATLALITAAATAASSPASAEAVLLVEALSGKVLHAENATYPWHPASLTKLMTTYVALHAVKDGRIALNSMIAVSELAHSQQPSKMGFKPGTQLTLDNAIKMLMVKSANDIAVAIAEGVSGSVDNFAAEMNAASQRLGMTQSNWVNPNGLPDDRQVTSARDLAILARALIHEFPEHDLYWHIPAIKFGKRIMRNYNKLIDRYPGADGMKTGFICASGFNLVARHRRSEIRPAALVGGKPW